MRRHWPYAVLIVLVLLAGVGAVTWQHLFGVHAVSVSKALDRYRTQHPAPPASVIAGPAPGVYVLATNGSERLSVGGLSHTYPKRTTLTITPSGSCATVRWDALAERWMQWQLCSSAHGWSLLSYTDLHKFLYREDRHDYRCPADAVVYPVGAQPSAFVCPTSNGKMAMTITDQGTESVTVAGVPQPATHLHVVLTATGASSNNGVADIWVRSSDALPLRATVTNHGHQFVLGSDIRYDEHASYLLTSTTPLR